MKILHTADIHLKEYGDERWEALKSLIEIGKKERVDIFIIAGDLFDKGVSAVKLRGKIRSLFSNIGFKVFILPGNHDRDVYEPNISFGSNVNILGDEPFEIEDVRFIGIPFEEMEGEELLEILSSLKPKLRKDGRNILIFHGELLDTFYSSSDFGEEGNKRYMPVKLSYFNELNIAYILAGHFHANFDIHIIKKDSYFVYPGSPLSITKRETGQRKINIFEFGNPPREYPLDTPYFEDIDIELDPFADEEPLEKVRKKIEELPENAKPLLRVTGYFNAKKLGIAEPALIESIKEMVKERCVGEPEIELKDIQTIMEDDLFKKFLEKLKKKDYDEAMRKEMRNVAIQAMMEVNN